MNKQIKVLFACVSILMMLSAVGCSRGYSTEKYFIWKVSKMPDGSEKVAYEGVADRWSIEMLRDDIVCFGADCLSEKATVLADSGKSSGLIAVQYPSPKQQDRTEAQWICKPLFSSYTRFTLATLIGRITTCYQIDKNGKVISKPTKLIARDSLDAETYCERGAVYFESGRYDEAILDYKKAIEMNPKFAEAFYNRGIAYYRKGQDTLAISDYAKAIEINPQLHQQNDVLIRMIREKWAKHKES